jgi:guanosine-diphosphatase
VYQPNLIDTFSTDKILLPYFYDQINSLRPVDQRDKLLTISSIPGLAKDVCTGPTLWEERWGSDKVVVEELEDRPVWYLDLTFVYTLLWLGYEFGEDGRAKIWKQIGGMELGWCLGATLATIGTNLTCRV